LYINQLVDSEYRALDYWPAAVRMNTTVECLNNIHAKLLTVTSLTRLEKIIRLWLAKTSANLKLEWNLKHQWKLQQRYPKRPSKTTDRHPRYFDGGGSSHKAFGDMSRVIT